MTVPAAPAPLVSVVITAYRRPDSLRRALRSAQAQIHEPKEILVIESLPRGEAASPPIVPDATGVRIVQVEDRGVCAARNLGARLARGAFVAVMDDDTYFPTVDELDRLVAAFDRSPYAACLVFRVLDTAGQAHLRDWCHPRSFWDAAEARFETCFIAEGACAFRREAFVRVGGYYEPFWIGNEGWDLALRFLDADLTIVYEPTVEPLPRRRRQRANAGTHRLPARAQLHLDGLQGLPRLAALAVPGLLHRVDGDVERPRPAVAAIRMRAPGRDDGSTVAPADPHLPPWLGPAPRDPPVSAGPARPSPKAPGTAATSHAVVVVPARRRGSALPGSLAPFPAWRIMRRLYLGARGAMEGRCLPRMGLYIAYATVLR